MIANGVTVDGRPKVQSVFPSGNGWAGTVPIVVVFNETLNQNSVAPGGSEPPTLSVRLAGSIGGGNVAADYDFLFGGRVVVIRPVAPFDTSRVETYEVVVSPELRDADGVRYGGNAEEVVGTFTADEDVSIDEGEIVAILPVDNSRDQQRESLVYAVFSKPVEKTSVSGGAGGNFTVRDAAGALVDGTLSFPLRDATNTDQDGRVLEFVPMAALAASTKHEVFLADTITFGSGVLDFKGRSPFSEFTTTSPPAIVSVTVGNALPTAPDQINAGNISSPRIDVDVPADALIGDRVEVRIYGLDKDGAGPDIVDFVEAVATLSVAGVQTVPVDLSGKLGTAMVPEFREGDLTIVARLIRGSRSSGYVLSDSANMPRLDVTPPLLTFPADDGMGNRVLYTDQSHLTFMGTGDEDLSAATMILDTLPSPTNGTTFGFGSGGRFMFSGVDIGRRTAPLGFTITVTDLSGNESAPIMGNVVQRGVVTGSVGGGTLIVEAFDDASFAGVPGVTVLIEPGMPTKPATGRMTMTTGVDGRAVFTGLAAPTYSVTLVGLGYDVVSLLDTAAGFVSLPMRPQMGATATVAGNLVFIPSAGDSAIVGTNIIDDVRQEEIRTQTTTPVILPTTAVRPNRPFVVTAFSGSFEPTSTPTFSNYACLICGPTGLTREAAQTPVAPGQGVAFTAPLIPAAGTTRNLASGYTKDLGTWGGLDAANLVGDPTVRVMASVFGLSGMTLTGVGFANQVGATTSYDIDATYSLSAALTMVSLGSRLWVSTEAEDTMGNVARHRRLVVDTTLGVTLASAATPGIPTVTAPIGPFTGSPAVTFQDRLSAASIFSGFGMQVLTATDSSGRNWRVLMEDTNGAVGGTTVQLPDFAGVIEPGLATGSWSVMAESHLYFNLIFSTGDFLIEEMRREEVTYSRAATQSFTVN